MLNDKEIFTHGLARVEVYEDKVWLQAGMFGLMLSPEELCNLYDLLHYLMEDEDE